VSGNSAIIEYRSYPMKPFGRDNFIDNFEAHFLVEMERFGASVLGQFRVIDDPDRFVWFRGFPDMVQRSASLDAFYSGDVWARHGDISKALFLRPLTVDLLRFFGGGNLAAGNTLAAALSAFAGGTSSVQTGVLVVDTFRATEVHRRDELVTRLQAAVTALEIEGAELRGLLVAEDGENDWPEQVICDPHEVVMVTAHQDHEVAELHSRIINEWAVQKAGKITDPPTTVQLLPTMRSAMRYR
jgi:hypothetical protein